jgi:AcrR family transcriptional regulator
VVSQAERRDATVGAIHAAARKLFGARGFEATSIDDIAAKAGVAKGAIYHHFSSKEEIFERILEDVQRELAARQMAVPPRSDDPADRIAAGALRYLLAACEPGTKQILLIDGPAVLGWTKWREIDMRYFGALAKAAIDTLLPDAPPRRKEAIQHLLLGAIMEAALVCATAVDPKKSARELTTELRKLLRGLAS